MLVAVIVGVAVAVGVGVRVGVAVDVAVAVGAGVGVEGDEEKSPFRLSRPPVTVFPANEAVGVALERIAFLICSAVAYGNTEA